MLKRALIPEAVLEIRENAMEQAEWGTVGKRNAAHLAPEDTCAAGVNDLPGAKTAMKGVGETVGGAVDTVDSTATSVSDTATGAVPRALRGGVSWWECPL